MLVVGAGPSGQQIADELARAGRDVHIAVGRHQMLPRRYRGHDSYWWLDRLGLLSRTVDSLAHPDDRFAPNAVLTGGTADLDLNRLVHVGVHPHGRLLGCDGTVLQFSDDLVPTYADAEANAVRFRSAVDEYVIRTGFDAQPAAQGPSVATAAAGTPALFGLHRAGRLLDLRAANLVGVIWATGFTADWSWLPACALHASGQPSQTRGVSPQAGLYFLGLKWQHRRSSHTTDGVGRDAEYLAEHIVARFAERADFHRQQTIVREGVAA